MSSVAEIIAEWAAKWEPLLLDRFDVELAARDASYNETWIFVEATDAANVDLNRRLAGR